MKFYIYKQEEVLGRARSKCEMIEFNILDETWQEKIKRQLEVIYGEGFEVFSERDLQEDQ